MGDGISITVLAPAFYQGHTDRIAPLVESAARYGIPLHLYGEGEPFRGWIDTHVDRLLPEVRKVTTTHVLFTDAGDAFFTAPMHVITARYVLRGAAPLLVSSEGNILMNAGGWMGEREAAIEALEQVGAETGGDPQVRWRKLIRDGAIGVAYDVPSSIFYVGAGDDLRVISRGHLLNGRLESLCHVHLAGGYTDPDVGKPQVMALWKRVRDARR